MTALAHGPIHSAGHIASDVSAGKEVGPDLDVANVVA